VTLKATANLGYAFKEWTGSVNSTSNPVTVVMDGDKTVTAQFYQAPSPTPTPTPTGTPKVTFYVNSHEVGPYTMLYIRSTTMNFKAVSDRPLSSVSVSISGTANATVDLRSTDGGMTWTGSWTAPGDGKYTVTAKAGYLGGEVTVCSLELAYGQVSAPPGKTALVFDIVPGNGGSVSVVSPEGQTVVDENSVVTVQAFPNQGFRFKGWGGDVTGKSQSLTFMAKGNSMTVIAAFEREVPPLDRAAGFLRDNLFKVLTAAGLAMVASGEFLERRRR